VSERQHVVGALPAGYEFHHIGYATASVEAEQGFFSFLGYQQEGLKFVDPVQGITGCFLTGPGPRIELLENLPGSTTLSPWLAAGVRMYHIAAEVDNLQDGLDWARRERGKVIVPPVPAVAFGGRRISFVAFRNGMILELIERAFAP